MSCERSHDVSVVVLGNTVEERDGTIHLVSSHESHNSDHGETAIVDLGDESRVLLLLAPVLAETKGIIEVEGDRVDGVAEEVEGRESARHSAAHVVGLAIVGSRLFTPELEEANNDEDLPLGGLRNSIPLGLGRKVSAGKRISSGSHGPGPVHITLHDVSNESEHSYASVLDLSVAEEANGGVIGISPELSIRETERVIKIDDRVELLRQSLQLSLTAL